MERKNPHGPFFMEISVEVLNLVFVCSLLRLLIKCVIDSCGYVLLVYVFVSLCTR